MEDEWRFVCVVRGYHVYKDVWDPYLGDGFTTKHERNNPHDKYAVAVLLAASLAFSCDPWVRIGCSGTLRRQLVQNNP